MSKRALFAFVCALVLTGTVSVLGEWLSRKDTRWRDPPKTPCAHWGAHREAQQVNVKGVAGWHWYTVRYCLDRPVNPDASIYGEN